MHSSVMNPRVQASKLATCVCGGASRPDPYEGQSDAFVDAALALEQVEDDDARHTCAYCLRCRWHAITIYVGLTPGGDECRACGECLGQLLEDRKALVASARSAARAA